MKKDNFLNGFKNYREHFIRIRLQKPAEKMQALITKVEPLSEEEFINALPEINADLNEVERLISWAPLREEFHSSQTQRIEWCLAFSQRMAMPKISASYYNLLEPPSQSRFTLSEEFCMNLIQPVSQHNPAYVVDRRAYAAIVIDIFDKADSEIKDMLGYGLTEPGLQIKIYPETEAEYWKKTHAPELAQLNLGAFYIPMITTLFLQEVKELKDPFSNTQLKSIITHELFHRFRHVCNANRGKENYFSALPYTNKKEEKAYKSAAKKSEKTLKSLDWQFTKRKEIKEKLDAVPDAVMASSMFGIFEIIMGSLAKSQLDKLKPGEPRRITELIQGQHVQVEVLKIYRHPNGQTVYVAHVVDRFEALVATAKKIIQRMKKIHETMPHFYDIEFLAYLLQNMPLPVLEIFCPEIVENIASQINTAYQERAAIALGTIICTDGDCVRASTASDLPADQLTSIGATACVIEQPINNDDPQSSSAASKASQSFLISSISSLAGILRNSFNVKNFFFASSSAPNTVNETAKITASTSRANDLSLCVAPSLEKSVATDDSASFSVTSECHWTTHTETGVPAMECAGNGFTATVVPNSTSGSTALIARALNTPAPTLPYTGEYDLSTCKSMEYARTKVLVCENQERTAIFKSTVPQAPDFAGLITLGTFAGSAIYRWCSQSNKMPKLDAAQKPRLIKKKKDFGKRIVELEQSFNSNQQKFTKEQQRELEIRIEDLQDDNERLTYPEINALDRDIKATRELLENYLTPGKSAMLLI